MRKRVGGRKSLVEQFKSFKNNQALEITLADQVFLTQLLKLYQKRKLQYGSNEFTRDSLHFKENINLTIWIKLWQIAEYFSSSNLTYMTSNIIFGTAVICDRLHDSFESLLVLAAKLCN